MPSYDMLCVTPATYGDNYKSNTTACAYMAGLLRGVFNCEMRLSFDVTPGDSGNSEVSIIAAGGQYGYVYMISSNRTTDNHHFQLGFVRQDTSDKNLLSMWWCNRTPGIFNIDYKYPLKAGIFSPLKYNTIDNQDLPNSTLDDLDQNDPSWKRLILISYNSNISSRIAGLARFLLDSYSSSGTEYYYIKNFGYLPYRVSAQQGAARRGSYDINTTEYLPFVKTSQIYLQQMPQPLLDETTHIYIYRTALNSPTNPGAGNVYKTSVGAFMLLYPGVLTYSVKLTD